MSDKPHLQFHQTLPGLSDKAHLIFFQTLPELSDKPHLPFLQTLSELPDKAHLFFFQTLPELSDKPHLKVESFRTTLHSILPLPIESSLKTTCIPKKKMEENPLPYHDEIILRTGTPSPNTSSRNILYFHFLFSIVLRRLSVFFECPDPLPAYTVILPPFRGFSLFCRRFPTHFSPASATGFLCLFSCFPAVEKSQNNVSENIKTYIYKNKFIFLFSYLSAQIFFYYNLHLLI